MESENFYETFKDLDFKTFSIEEFNQAELIERVMTNFDYPTVLDDFEDYLQDLLAKTTLQFNHYLRSHLDEFLTSAAKMDTIESNLAQLRTNVASCQSKLSQPQFLKDAFVSNISLTIEKLNIQDIEHRHLFVDMLHDLESSIYTLAYMNAIDILDEVVFHISDSSSAFSKTNYAQSNMKTFCSLKKRQIDSQIFTEIPFCSKSRFLELTQVTRKLGTVSNFMMNFLQYRQSLVENIFLHFKLEYGWELYQSQVQSCYKDILSSTLNWCLEAFPEEKSYLISWKDKLSTSLATKLQNVVSLYSLDKVSL